MVNILHSFTFNLFLFLNLKCISCRFYIIKFSFLFRITTYFFNFNFLLLFSYSCPHLPPLLSPVLPTTHIPNSILTTTVFVHGSFIHVLWPNTSPSFSHYPPPPSLLVASSLFFISMSQVLFFSLDCFVHHFPLIHEII